ncbi:unnamed protein product [Lactuca saligna]|uniref:Uncharacterized protein n=1 Tax=Lactuca saligna TaxID=75948 RepID=A0AA35Z6V4_LACSI|nr:unnamed protein product [Lactuca saligna]
MASIGHAEHNWSPNYRRHMDENHLNGVTNEDMAINLLQTQLELSLIQEDFQDQLRELRRIVDQDLDAMNREVDDVRAGAYVKMVFKDNKRKKLMYCVGIVSVVSASVVTYLVFKFGGGVTWAADDHRFLMKFFVYDLCNRLWNSRK